jgi:hypothetical protein
VKGEVQAFANEVQNEMAALYRGRPWWTSLLSLKQGVSGRRTLRR